MGKTSSKEERGGRRAESREARQVSVRSEIKEMLRTEGLRVTRPRLEVLVVLHERAAPMTHEQIMENLPDGFGDKASIWRLLGDLSERGILRRMDLGDRVWRYELIDSCRGVADDHAHLLCEDCGDVKCLPAMELRAKDGSVPSALLAANFQIRIIGQCGDCP